MAKGGSRVKKCEVKKQQKVCKWCNHGCLGVPPAHHSLEQDNEVNLVLATPHVEPASLVTRTGDMMVPFLPAERDGWITVPVHALGAITLMVSHCPSRLHRSSHTGLTESLFLIFFFARDYATILSVYSLSNLFYHCLQLLNSRKTLA